MTSVRASTEQAACAIDHLEAVDYAAIGRDPVLILSIQTRDLLGRAKEIRKATRAVIIGVVRGDVALGADDLEAFDVVLADRPGLSCAVACDPGGLDTAARGLADHIRTSPHAATMLCQVLRAVVRLDTDAALSVESFAYSALLGGEEFRQWLTARPHRPGRREIPEMPVRITRSDDHVQLTLADPGGRNAMSASMRDALYEGLAAALDDPSRPFVSIDADGRCFSVGGDLGEFGHSRDLAYAHGVRMERSCARLVLALGDRCAVRLHGACIGAGIEIGAAAAHRSATMDAFMQLPEVSMGLIPGAGGTVTLSRAIGRHRTAFLALSGRRVRMSSVIVRGLATVAP